MGKLLALPRFGICLAIALAVLMRLAAQNFMPSLVESDSAAYFAMAKSLSDGDVMRDIFGQIAFYSPGYPLLLAPVFAVFGSSANVALWLNLALAAITVLLVYRVALRISRSPVAAALVSVGYALWIPSVLQATSLSKENLSVPLMLGFVWALLMLRDGPRPMLWATMAGLFYGASVLTGASALLIVLGLAAVHFEQHGLRNFSDFGKKLLAFTFGTALMLVPWMLHTNAQLGQPVLTSNSGFNLYLGNNPAATGRFVGIERTPAGPRWNTMREQRGEVGASTQLGAEAKEYMLGHPGRTITLGFKKLALFWTPNLPDAMDFKANAKIAGARWIDVAQHILIILAGLWAAIIYGRRSPEVRIVIATILGFWAVHAATYNIVRYREPVMPLMLALSSLPIAQIFARKQVQNGKA